MAKFDLENALIADGFAMTNEHTSQWDKRYMFRTYTKEFVKILEVAWYGQNEYHFIADVQVTYFNGKPIDVVASYSNGKVKEYAYDKRAYNAIRDTIKNNGFDIVY